MSKKSRDIFTQKTYICGASGIRTQVFIMINNKNYTSLLFFKEVVFPQGLSGMIAIHHLILLSINKEKVEFPSAKPQQINVLKVGYSALVFIQAFHTFCFQVVWYSGYIKQPNE